MEEVEYRYFVTEIQTLRAENAALRKTIETERADQDAHFAGIETERAAKDKLIAELRAKINRLLKARMFPGIIAGGGMTTRGEAEGVVGIGWKIDLW
jgi:hypothetical protein